jgi:hypothetical protein
MPNDDHKEKRTKEEGRKDVITYALMPSMTAVFCT